MIGQAVSHYRILEKLGEGGMGVVYKAEDTKLKRTVALKFLAPDLTRDDTAKRRFIHEARAASALDHPNIAVVHEIDETDDGKAFICMAYYQGQTLKERLERGPLPIEQAVRIALQIADGLQRAHEAGIVHLDIKPANIVLTEQDIVKIVDFGLAKLSSDTRRSKSAPFGPYAGTAAYMSPEQVQGIAVDHRSDLFSLGIVLYEMLTGSRPFPGEHEAALFYSIVNLEPIPPSKLRVEIPPGLEHVTQCLLKKSPIERYQNAAAVRADLEVLPSTGWEKMPLLRRANAAKLMHLPAKYLLPSIGALVLVVAGLIWSLIPKKSFSLDPSAYVVVADVENTTGNKFFEHSLTEAIKVSLRQSPRINLLPPERIAAALRRMRIEEQHRLDEPTALAAARREDAKVVVAGAINPLGAGYVLTCKIIDAARGETLKIPRREISRVEDVLDGLDKLCEEIRASLGESLQEISENATPLEKVTTASLEALELYSQGDRMERQGKYEAAALLKGQAAEIDSLFTMAVSDLSYIHRKLGHDSIAIAYHRRVPSLLNRVTERERYYILTTFYGPSFEFDFRKAFENAHQMVLRYPNSAEAHGQLGHLAMYFCELTTALEENNKALALDSAFAGSVYNNSGYSAALAGDVVNALGYFRKSKQLRPTYYAIDAFIAHALWIGEKLDSAEHTLRAIIPRGDLRRQILSHSQLATLYLSQGRLGQAETECDSGVALLSRGKSTVSEAYFHYLLGEIAFERGNRATYTREMHLAEETAQAPYADLVLIAVHYARTGRERDARRLLSRISRINSVDPYFVRRRNHFLHWVKGEMLLAQRMPDQAKQELDAIEKVHCGDPIYFSAQRGIAMCSESVSDSLAILHFLRLLSRRGELIMGPLLSYPATGSWTSHIWPEAHLALGKLFLRRGNKPEASRNLAAALRYWRDADPIFPKALEAKALMDKLQKPQ